MVRGKGRWLSYVVTEVVGRGQAGPTSLHITYLALNLDPAETCWSISVPGGHKWPLIKISGVHVGVSYLAALDAGGGHAGKMKWIISLMLLVGLSTTFVFVSLKSSGKRLRYEVIGTVRGLKQYNIISCLLTVATYVVFCRVNERT